MLRDFQPTPASTARGFLKDAASHLTEVADETIEADDALDAIETAEKSLAVVRHYLRKAKAKAIAQANRKPANGRVIPRDVACRYIQRYGGSTYHVPTAFDASIVCLIDADGARRGEVSMRDKFPKPAVSFSDIPF